MMGPNTHYELGKMRHAEYEASVRKSLARSTTEDRTVLVKERFVRWPSTFAILIDLFRQLKLRSKLAVSDHYAGPQPEGCTKY